MWGCQEQGSGPVAPEGLGPQFGGPHPVHGDGGGEPTKADATVELREGLKTLLPGAMGKEDVQIRKDNRSILQVQRDGFTSEIDLSFTLAEGLIKCSQEGGGEAPGAHAIEPIEAHVAQ